jgi:signal transduction histidine kinase/CHASE3 domain sensor protein
MAVVRTERKVQAGFAFALVLLSVIGILSYRSVVRLREDRARVVRTHEVIGSMRRLLSIVTDAEAGMRGYTVTGQESYLLPHEDALRSLEGELQRLRTLTADDADRQRQLGVLAGLIAERMSAVREIVALRRDLGFEAARAAIATGRGKEIHRRIRELLADMEEAEEVLLHERDVNAERSSALTKTVIVAGSVVAFGFVGLALFFIGQDFSGRERADAALREANDHLEARVEERTTDLRRTNESLHESRAQFSTAFDSLSEGLIVSALDGQLHWNRAAVAMHGFGSLAECLLQLPDLGEILQLSTLGGVVVPLDQWPLSRILRGEQLRDLEVRVRRLDQDWERIFTYGGYQVRHGDGRALAVLSISDITERKRVEEEIHHLNVGLEQRVVERTAQLEAANKDLEAFTYSVSHDLRAPLRAVDGFSQALLEDFGPQLPEEGQRQVRTIREGAQRMGALIDDLLAFARLGRQSPSEPGVVDMDRLVREVLEELLPERQGRRVEIRAARLPPCNGDDALLKQVWANLLSNALKYTRKRDPAVVEIGSVVEDGATVYFVRDNGTGFDMRYAHKLFGVFQRLHRAEDFEGSGVGLAIVHRIIRRHGGRVWAEAAVDRGATFRFTLPEGAAS